MIAWIPLPNMVVCRTEAVLETLSPVLTETHLYEEARMAEISPSFYHICRQEQTRFCGVLA